MPPNQDTFRNGTIVWFPSVGRW